VDEKKIVEEEVKKYRVYQFSYKTARYTVDGDDLTLSEAEEEFKKTVERLKNFNINMSFKEEFLVFLDENTEEYLGKNIIKVATIKKSGKVFLEEMIESLNEDFEIELPVTALPENEILDYIHSVPKATAQRGPASLTFSLGFVTNVEVASQFKENSRGHINKETGETFPVVGVVKCSEISNLYLESYKSSKKTIAHDKQIQKYMGDEPETVEPKREVIPWLDPVEGQRNLFTSKKTGEYVLVPLVANNSRTKTKYFISIDGEPLRPTTKEEILPYLTTAKQLELTNGRADRLKFGPDGKEIVSAAQPLTFYFKKIYYIGDKGQSIF